MLNRFYALIIVLLSLELFPFVRLCVVNTTSETESASTDTGNNPGFPLQKILHPLQTRDNHHLSSVIGLCLQTEYL